MNDFAKTILKVIIYSVVFLILGLGMYETVFSLKEYISLCLILGFFAASLN